MAQPERMRVSGHFSKMAVAFCYINYSCSRLLHKRQVAF